MDKIYISIIVPAYNIEKYIGRCLDSIISQSYKELEIIVVDDGSTDETGKIIDRYAMLDQRIISIHKENGGVSSARLAGLRKVTGTYIGFVDGDDYIEPEMFEHLLKNAIEYKADISHCGYKMVFPDGHVDLYYGTGKKVEQTREKGLLDLLNGEYVEPGLWNKLYHKSIVVGFEESPIWDSGLKINEDLLMNYLLFKRSNCSIYEDKTYYHYMLRKGSAATSKKQYHQVMDPYKVIRAIKDDCSNNSELYSKAYSRYLRSLINVILQKDWEDESKEAKKILKKELRDKKHRRNYRSKKLYIMSIAVAWLEPLYKVVRLIYEKKTGISKKYEIN